MSLDVYLKGPPREEECWCSSCQHKHTATIMDSYFEANITHNLGEMAESAELYKCLWRPEELGITTASQLIVPLTLGLRLLKAEPLRFQKLNSPNGFGKYEHLVSFVSGYLKACIEFPDASVIACR